MSRNEILSLTSFASLFSLKGAHLLAYSWIFGMSIWITFIGGPIAYKTLTRQQFSTLQHRYFRVYFGISTALSVVLLGNWTFSHPDVVRKLAHPEIADVSQAYALLIVLIMHVAQQLVLGPLVSKIMFQRFKLEKMEGKDIYDPAASNQMKSLNKQFGQAHGWSSLANLMTIFALAYHGLWIGNVGLEGN